MGDWKDSLKHFFENEAKEGSASLLGVEVEHFIVDAEDKTAVPYAGERGVEQVLVRLMERYPDAKRVAGESLLGFSVPDFSITLEPAAQLEISIAPIRSIREIGEIYQSFSETLSAVLSEFGYEARNVGCQPVSKVEQLALIPKKRYEWMDAHFKSFGTGGMEMMRGTASLQVSIDYESEEDFRSKIQAAYFFGPLLKMFCDHSPTFQGEPLYTHLKRTDIWRRVDPLRCGILPGIFSESFGFADYVEFLGKMPPIFLEQGEEMQRTGTQTVAELFAGRPMKEEEIGHILSMAFPDVRLKQYLEIRFADSVELPMVLAYCALIRGLLYSKEGLAFAREQISSMRLTEKDICCSEDALMLDGWRANVYGRSALEWARSMLKLARHSISKEEKGFLDVFEQMLDE
ncbi:MAG: hypothetical protein IJ679_04890 [Lachnospiraceae bacterium]|nr:hypothetical protein [Lachnospiraceae bacterium]